MKFCQKLNESGKAPSDWKFTLPTEAQWEYACRAGTTTAFNNGKNIRRISELGLNNCPNLDKIGWYRSNSGRGVCGVGQKQPNAWGLYDMHGNAAEWCLDWYGEYSGDATDPAGPEVGKKRASRGGDAESCAEDCRSAHRWMFEEGKSFCGFRIVLVPIQK